MPLSSRRHFVLIYCAFFALPLCLMASQGFGNRYALFWSALYAVGGLALLFLLFPVRRRAVEARQAVGGIRTQFEASRLLMRCLSMASQRRSRFGSSAIDMRRLFEHLQRERGAAIGLFSRTEERLIFANSFVEPLFGFSPDRFARDFSELIEGGREQWEDALANLSDGSEIALRLVLRTLAGEGVVVHCLLGLVGDGPFRGMAVAVFYR